MGALGDNGGFMEVPIGGGLKARVTFVSCGGVTAFNIPECPTANGKVDGKGRGEFSVTLRNPQFEPGHLAKHHELRTESENRRRGRARRQAQVDRRRAHRGSLHRRHHRGLSDRDQGRGHAQESTSRCRALNMTRPAPAPDSSGIRSIQSPARSPSPTRPNPRSPATRKPRNAGAASNSPTAPNRPSTPPAARSKLKKGDAKQLGIYAQGACRRRQGDRGPLDAAGRCQRRVLADGLAGRLADDPVHGRQTPAGDQVKVRRKSSPRRRVAKRHGRSRSNRPGTGSGWGEIPRRPARSSERSEMDRVVKFNLRAVAVQATGGTTARTGGRSRRTGRCVESTIAELSVTGVFGKNHLPIKDESFDPAERLRRRREAGAEEAPEAAAEGAGVRRPQGRRRQIVFIPGGVRARLRRLPAPATRDRPATPGVPRSGRSATTAATSTRRSAAVCE